MKNITLARKGIRILARAIDLSIVLVLTLILFLGAIFPLNFDKEKFESNNVQIVSLYEQSDLFIVDENGNYNAKSAFSNIKELKDIYSFNVTFGGTTYQDVSLTKSLYNFYTNNLSKYSELENLTNELYETNILKINTQESNIKEYNYTTHTFILLDETKPDVTISYFISQFKGACNYILNNKKIIELTNENKDIVFSCLKLFIPVLIGISLIFDLLIPLFSKEGQTIGKHIFGLAVLDKDGYKCKKIKFILRYIIYIGVEIILGFITMGGVIMISYTMFMFVKNRRCLHDLLVGTIVINKKESFFFDSPIEERYYEERSKRRGRYYG